MNDVLETCSSIFSMTRFEKQLKSNGVPGGKRTISNHLRYLGEAFFVFIDEKFSYSPRPRIVNPEKIYLSDAGLAALGRPFSENLGRILVNVVDAEFIRPEAELHYFNNRYECDFIIKESRRPAHTMQVCREMNGRNEKRELDGLADARKALDLTAGLILTCFQEEELKTNGLKVSILPVWKWLPLRDFTG